MDVEKCGLCGAEDVALDDQGLSRCDSCGVYQHKLKKALPKTEEKVFDGVYDTARVKAGFKKAWKHVCEVASGIDRCPKCDYTLAYDLQGRCSNCGEACSDVIPSNIPEVVAKKDDGLSLVDKLNQETDRIEKERKGFNKTTEATMEGSILQYSEIEKVGIIKGDDGKRYKFTFFDWKSEEKLRVGDCINFLLEDGKASQIYISKQSVNDLNISVWVSNFQNSEVGQKLKELFEHGMHNKFGVISSAILFVSLFLPIAQIPFAGNVNLLYGDSGKLLFVILAILAVFFYGGATRHYTKICTVLALAIIFLQYYDIFSGLNQVNVMLSALNQINSIASEIPSQYRSDSSSLEYIHWGAPVNILACIAIGYSAFIKEYSSNISR
jgi:hypothetical protein